MEYLLLILGLVSTFISGILCYLTFQDDSVPAIGCIVLFIIASVCLTGSFEIALKNNSYTIEALNGTLEYDTVSLDKNGKLLEIKIK